jgi:hypothetical protein
VTKRQADNIDIELREISCEVVNLIEHAQDMVNFGPSTIESFVLFKNC